MSLQHLLALAICKTFISACGKWQAKSPTPKAFVVGFKTSVDYNKEEGYRYVDLALYASHNYVSVYSRERWDVIPLEDLDYDEESEEMLPKKGKDYIKGETPWKLLGSHDSGWSGAVQDFIQLNAYQLDTFDSTDNFYKLVDAADLFD